MSTNYLAIDLGAESGRVILGELQDQVLTLRELHRFANEPTQQAGSLCWNIPRLFGEIIEGLKIAGKLDLPLKSVSCDAWGVDYLLFDEQGGLMPPAFHYRDPRCRKGVEAVFEKLDWPAIFSETGIQFLEFNTLFQLAVEDPERLKKAERLLMVADGVNYMLSGNARAEASMASTSQLYNPRIDNWSRKLIAAMGVPIRLFAPIVASGTRLGPLKPELEMRTGLQNLEVVASCSHDTASAVAAVPATESNWAYLSSGTWSLMGVELDKPCITEECRNLNFTNEIGYGNTIRLLKNIIGLWMVQECRRQWADEGRDYSYEELTQAARRAAPFQSLVNPADPRFIRPDDMSEAIADYCRETKQKAPAEVGDTIRCVLESLALFYAKTLRQIDSLLGRTTERLHIVGGGSKNEFLNQLTANACGVPVHAGPAEATAAGNILVQAITLKHLPNLDAARSVVANSFELSIFQPEPELSWDEAWHRFNGLP